MCCNTAMADGIRADSGVNKEEYLKLKLNNDQLLKEVALLNRLINEMSDKNNILKENNRLLLERISNAHVNKNNVMDQNKNEYSGRNPTELPIQPIVTDDST